MFTTRIVWEIWVGLLLAAVAASGGVIVDRKAWKEGFDINTDYHDHWPNTGVLREVCTYTVPVSQDEAVP